MKDSRHLFQFLIFSIAISLSSKAAASGVSVGDFEFVFNGIATLAVLGGFFLIWLGYKLFIKGIRKGKGKLEAKVKFVNIIFSGAGPGLFFMAFGAIILIVALIIFGVTNT